MARTKKLTVAEQLEKITEEIAETEQTLKELKRTRKELEEQVRMGRLIELDDLIAAKGLSLDEVRELLEQ